MTPGTTTNARDCSLKPGLWAAFAREVRQGKCGYWMVREGDALLVREVINRSTANQLTAEDQRNFANIYRLYGEGG